MTRLSLFALCLLTACSGGQRPSTAAITGVCQPTERKPGTVPNDQPEAETTGVCEPTERKPGMLPSNRKPEDEHAGIVDIWYSVRGGSASRHVRADGVVSGHHQSGAPDRPFMSVEHGRVSEDCVRAVWAVAERVMQATTPQPSPAQEPGSTSISIRVSGNSEVTVSWSQCSEPANTDVRILRRLLDEMKIGYW